MKRAGLISFVTAVAIPLLGNEPSAIPDFCHKNRVGVLSKIAIPDSADRPNYFFRAFPRKRMLSYATAAGNRILDMDTGKHYPLPGEFDPVPLNEDLMTVPFRKCATVDGKWKCEWTDLGLFSIAKILAGGENPGPVISLPILGSYQSVGLLKKGKKGNTYRIVTGDQFSEVEETGDGSVRMVTKPQTVCSNLDKKIFDLPMLSKNGQEISGWDRRDSLTKIWRLNPSNGHCTEVDRLDSGVGKADFSYDGKKLVFHLSSKGAALPFDSDGAFRATFDASELMDVWVYDRKTKKRTPLTTNRDSSSSYPVWREDGTILFAHIDANGEAAFFHVDPSKAEPQARTQTECATCKGTEGSDKNSILGKTWYQICAALEAPMAGAAALIPLSLESKQCLALADAAFEKNKNINGISLDVLRAACPKEKKKEPGEERLDPNKVFAKKCGVCHRAGSVDEFLRDDNSTEKQVRRMDAIRRISVRQSDPDYMPMGGSLSPAEKAALLSAFHR